jgi:excisionase family DNA binding protein
MMTGRDPSRERGRALSPVEVAALLGVSRSTIYEMIRRGIIPHVRITTGRIVIEVDELDKYLELRRHTAEEAAERWTDVNATYR